MHICGTMVFNNKQFREVILIPTLMAIQKWTPEAEELMIGTMAHESDGGTYLVQIEGPAIGIYGMQQNDHDDIWNAYLPNQSKLTYDLLVVCGMSSKPKFEAMKYHLVYATCMARIHYLRRCEAIPKDLEGQAEFWKTHYNSNLGKGTVQEYVADYLTFTGARNENIREGKGQVQKRDVKKSG